MLPTRCVGLVIGQLLRRKRIGETPRFAVSRRVPCARRRRDQVTEWSNGNQSSLDLRAPLVGRSLQLEVIARLLSDVTADHGSVMVMHGEPGIGKSTLLQHCANNAQGITLLRATGFEIESNIPYAGLVGVLRPIVDRLSTISTAGRRALRAAIGQTTDEMPPPFAVAAGALELLAATASATAVMMILDDAHWIDQQSMAALLFALRRLEGERFGALLAVPLGHSLLVELRSFAHLAVTGLSPQETVALLAETDARITSEVA